MKHLKIGNSWIRGIVGNGLTPELVTDFSCAFGTYASGGVIILARDTRYSSKMFELAALSGLISTGCNVLNAGICPTPVAQYLVRQKKAVGGIVITGSHNDSSWNALKFIDAGGALFNPIRSEEVLDLYHMGEFTKASWDKLGQEEHIRDYAREYLANTIEKLDLKAIRAANFKVIADLGNGTAGSIIKEFFKLLNCDSILINDEISGNFAHNPAPIPANMVQLACLLRNLDSDIGFALNSDVDRVGIVTEKGEALSEEYIFPLIVDHVLSREKGVVVTNFSTSMMAETIVKSHGGKLIRTKIGEGNIMFRALNENAILAGEGSGGVAYIPISRAFDGFITMTFLLQAMAQTNSRISSLSSKLPSFPMRKGTLSCSTDRIYYALEEMRKYYKKEKIDLTDGVRVQWPGLWLHVRASNTEPLLRVIVEGEDKKKTDRIFSDTISWVNNIVHGKS